MRSLLIILMMGLALFNCGKERVKQNIFSPPRAGGETTVDDRTHSAFEVPAPNLMLDEAKLHADGDRGFEDVFVSAPAAVNPGLGPVFNNNSCAGCHIHNGRGMAILGEKSSQLSHMLVRVSQGGPVINKKIGVNPLSVFGGQLQDHATAQETPEVSIKLSWIPVSGKYPDGEPYSLRKPHLAISALKGQALPEDLLTSLRQPPPVFGLGLLEALTEDTILTHIDENDQNQDGISGKANYVYDPTSDSFKVGRFGWKANTANLLVQAAAAYFNDMGISNPIFNDDLGISPDIDLKKVEETAGYTQTLAVPGRTLIDDNDVRVGEQLFRKVSCSSCHLETLVTGHHDKIAALSNQTIHPYTDLLLHDMGEELADNRPDFLASGREWRTAPLWGIGLTQTVLPYSSFLHDGRARSLEEAILWHGGEAEKSLEAFKNLSKFERSQLLRFLMSL